MNRSKTVHSVIEIRDEDHADKIQHDSDFVALFALSISKDENAVNTELELRGYMDFENIIDGIAAAMAGCINEVGGTGEEKTANFRRFICTFGEAAMNLNKAAAKEGAEA